MNPVLKKTACTVLLSFVFLCSNHTLVLAEPSNGGAMAGEDGRIRWETSVPWRVEEKALDMVNTLDGKHVFLLTGSQKIQVYTTQGALLGTIPVARGVSLIQLSPTGDKLYLFDAEKKNFTTLSITFLREIDTTDAPFKGMNNAPISIVVFTDFECPFCKKLPPLLDEVLANNPENVKLFFKNMPLISIHKMAEDAARAGIAAKNQGKFWEYHDKLFAAKELSAENLQSFAKELGLDMKRFDSDMYSPATTAILQKDMFDAQKSGVEGTPTIFINGWPLENRSLKGFQKMIDAQLGKR